MGSCLENISLLIEGWYALIKQQKLRKRKTFRVEVASPKAPEGDERVSYLIGACDARSVEHRKKEFRCEEDHKCVGNDEKEEGCPKAIDFSRSPQDSDSWHEAGCQRQSYWAKAHLPPSYQEFPRCCFFSLLYGKKHTNSRGNDKEACKHNIIPSFKVLHLHAWKQKMIVSCKQVSGRCFQQQMLFWEGRMWFSEGFKAHWHV